MTFILSSPAFADGDMIPVRFTCDGEEISPPLVWEGVPEAVESFALIMEDPDIPAEVRERLGIDTYIHWVRFNIPKETRALSEGEETGVSGVTSAGTLGYVGPCPPPQFDPPEHRYFFYLYALDTLLQLPEGVTAAELRAAMEPHILAKATLMGRFRRDR